MTILPCLICDHMIEELGLEDVWRKRLGLNPQHSLILR